MGPHLAAVVRRRALALGLVAATTVLAALAPRLGLMLPRPPELAMIVGGVLVAALIAARLVVRARRTDETARHEHARAEAARAFAAELVWVDTTNEAETPEVDLLRQALARRHEEARALGGEAASRPVALQREALAEAARRGWLGAERLVVLERHLLAMTAEAPTPTADPTRPLLHVATAAYGALLPIDAYHRISTALVAALVGLTFVVVEALSE